MFLNLCKSKFNSFHTINRINPKILLLKVKSIYFSFKGIFKFNKKEINLINLYNPKLLQRLQIVHSFHLHQNHE